MSTTTTYDARGGMRNVWIITAAMTVLAICYTMIIPFLPIYLLELGVPKADVALWSGLVLVLPFSLQALWRLYGAKLPIIKGKTDGLARWLCHCYLLCINWLSYRPISITDGACLVGFANGFYPAAMTMVSLSVDEKQVGRALGIFQTGLIFRQCHWPIF